MCFVCSAVSGILGDLKRQAQQMNDELDEQNTILDRMNIQAQVNTTNIYKNTDRTAKMS